jgi:hypothetical protein
MKDPVIYWCRVLVLSAGLEALAIWVERQRRSSDYWHFQEFGVRRSGYGEGGLATTGIYNFGACICIFLLLHCYFLFVSSVPVWFLRED